MKTLRLFLLLLLLSIPGWSAPQVYSDAALRYKISIPSSMTVVPDKSNKATAPRLLVTFKAHGQQGKSVMTFSAVASTGRFNSQHYGQLGLRHVLGAFPGSSVTAPLAPRKVGAATYYSAEYTVQSKTQLRRRMYFTYDSTHHIGYIFLVLAPPQDFESATNAFEQIIAGTDFGDFTPAP